MDITIGVALLLQEIRDARLAPQRPVVAAEDTCASPNRLIASSM
jgi:hypothetical protein